MVKLIGISAHAARSGKDTLAQCLQTILTENGKTSIIKSLASPLKDKMKDFIMSEFGIDVLNCTDEEKLLIRPLLVAFGGAKRRRTQGKYWTSLMDAEILNAKEKTDFLIIPDIRYCDFEDDECNWLKKKGGILFYIKMELEDGTFLPPPNEDEERNSPLLEAKSDIYIKWKQMNYEDCLSFARKTYSTYEQYLQ